MSAPPYMAWYVGDYLADTHHLDRGEHGAYCLLLMAMWRAGGRLPSDELKLARIAKCSAEEWALIRETMLAFFKRRGGHITQNRLTKEMAKYENKICNASKGGKASALKKHRKINGNFDNSLGVQLVAKINQPEPEPEIDKSSGAKAPSQRGSRIAPDWRPSAEDVLFAEQAGFTAIEITSEADGFLDYWQARSRDATRMDWSKTFRTRIRDLVAKRPKGAHLNGHATNGADPRNLRRIDNYRRAFNAPSVVPDIFDP